MVADPVRPLLLKSQALSAFETLVSDGCDEDFLVGPLILIHQNWHCHDRCEHRTGLTQRRLKATTRRIRSVAEQIREINRNGLGLELIPPSRVNSLSRLPEMLLAYTAVLERHPLAHLGRNATLHLLKFEITHHVKTSAKRFHDEEVAAVISAMLPSDPRGRRRQSTYDALSHKQWRSDHYDAILSNMRKVSNCDKIRSI